MTVLFSFPLCASCVCVCVYSSVVFLYLTRARWAESRGLPPIFRPEPIVMTSPQGSIHFNYHPLGSVCVRRPGKHFFFFFKHATKGNKQPARSVRKQGAGLCDSLWKLGHICISERFSGTRGNRLSWSNRVAQHIWSTRCEVTVGVCTAYLRVCPSIWLKLQPVASKECRRTEKSPQSVNVLCL